MTASWVKQAGNIEFLIMAIGGVVFFTLLLVTGNTMALSVRERMGELAVMKAVGFSDRFVLFIVLAESLTIALIGGVLGILLAKLMTLGGDPTGGVLYSFHPAGLGDVAGDCGGNRDRNAGRNHSGDECNASARG